MTYISPYSFVLAFFFTQNFFAEKLDVSTTSKESYSLPFSKFNVGNEPKEKQDTSMGTNGVHDKRALQVNENTSEVLSDLLQSSDWNTYLPYRWGYDIVSLERTDDFYTYEKLNEAITTISKFELLIERRCGTNQTQVTHTNLETNVSKIVSISTHYNATWNIIKPLVKEKVSYAKFLSEGTIDTRKRELAAFLANISHETTGGPISGNTYEWGLFFREEGENTEEPPNDYVSTNAEYPPVPGKSYHGRGPIQLSYNYNYGQASEHIFGDKTILLNNPELVSTDASISFMTAIWFWMTPQAPKPSAHDVMVGNWTPTDDEILDHRLPGLGMTANIINGGVECGLADTTHEKPQMQDRINYYKRYTGLLQVSKGLDGDETCNTCGCASMKNYANGGISESCDPQDIISIVIEEPIDGALIEDSSLGSRTIKSVYPTDKGTVSDFKLIIDNDTYTNTDLNWSPRFFKSYTIEGTVNIEDIPYMDTAVVTIYDDSNTIDCSNLEVWESKDYDGGSIVQFNDEIFRSKYYTSTEPSSTEWEKIGGCLSNVPPTLSISSTKKDANYEIKANSSDADSGLFFIDLYVNGDLKESYNPRLQISDVINSNEHDFLVVPNPTETEHKIKVITYDKYGASESKEITITTTLGLDNVSLDLFKLYPNPVNDKLIIENDISIESIKIMDIQGKEVLYKKMQNTDSIIELGHLNTGLYFLEIKTNTKKLYKKIFKK